MGELTQSFAQVTNAINQTKQTNLNRDIASSNISFRNQQSDLAQRQFEAEQIQQQRANLIENADKSLDFYTTVGPLLPPQQQQELFQETSNQYKRAGLIPEGMAFDFESAEEASNKVIERTIRGDIQGAQDEIQRFKTSGFKPVVEANLPKIQADAAIAERAGNFKNIIDLRSKGLAVSRSEWEHIKTTNPERAQQLEDGKNVYEDETIQAADRRSTELDYWRKVPPEILNDIIRIKRIADVGGVVSSPDLQKQVAASEYQSLAALAADEEAAGNVVPDSLRNAMNVQLAVMGVGEKIPVENEQARLERRRLKAQEAEIRSKISSRTIENSRIIAQTNVLKATLPQIAQNIENMKATGENTQARTALFQNQLIADQKKMQAIAPRLVQARDELMQQGQEIYEQLEATAHDRDMDPLEREKLYDQLEANAKATTDLNAQIEFAEAVGPELFLSYEKLGAQMEDMELRRNKNETSLNSLQQQRQALVAAQTEGKMQKNRIDFESHRDQQATGIVSAEVSRRGIDPTNAQAVIAVADELKASGVIPQDAIVTSGATAKAVGGAAGGEGDPFAVTRAVSTAINIAAKNSNVAVINPVTGQVDAIALFEKNPKNTDDYIQSLQTQANSNPALKQGLQPIINDLKDKQRRVKIQKERFQSVEKKLPHDLEAPVSADGTTMEQIIDQIEGGDRDTARFKSNGTVFTVSKGPGGKVQISAELDGEDLTFTLEGKGKKRQWLYMDTN